MPIFTGVLAMNGVGVDHVGAGGDVLLHASDRARDAFEGDRVGARVDDEIGVRLGL